MDKTKSFLPLAVLAAAGFGIFALSYVAQVMTSVKVEPVKVEEPSTEKPAEKKEGD